MNQDRSTTITNSQLKEGYKQTEVGIIPEDWNVYRIQELIDNKTIVDHLDGNHGELYPKSHEFQSYGIPYITANDLVNRFVSFQKCKFLSQEKASLFRKGIAKNGDVLFAHNATVGPVSLLSTNLEYVILSTTATYFRCEPQKLNNYFLLYLLQSSLFVTQYQSVMAQSTRNQVPITAQRKLFIPLPPTKEEQEAIACTLSDIDALIESLDRLLTKKRQIKQGAMQELLRSKDGWEKKRIGDVLTISHGRSQHEVVDENGDYPILASGGQIGRAKTYLYNKPSVLIGRKGTIDKPQYMDRPFWTVDTLFYSVIHEPNNAKYLFYQFCLIPWREYNEASGVPSLNARTIESIEITVPSLKEQIEIANILSDMDAEIGSISAKLTKTRQLKQGMMHELLTGRIRLVDAKL
jgi:type I restriction enzyme, S subunit